MWNLNIKLQNKYILIFAWRTSLLSSICCSLSAKRLHLSSSSLRASWVSARRLASSMILRIFLRPLGVPLLSLILSSAFSTSSASSSSLCSNRNIKQAICQYDPRANSLFMLLGMSRHRYRGETSTVSLLESSSQMQGTCLSRPLLRCDTLSNFELKRRMRNWTVHVVYTAMWLQSTEQHLSFLLSWLLLFHWLPLKGRNIRCILQRNRTSNATITCKSLYVDTFYYQNVLLQLKM